MTSVLSAGGVRLPLEYAADGPMVSTRADPDVEPLAWVLNAAVTGMLPGLRDAVAAGEDEVVQGLFAARPDPLEDHERSAATWRRLSGQDPGDDSYVVGTTFSDHSVLVPRPALLEMLDALERLRAGGDGGPPAGELDDLERRAAELERVADPAAASAKRRFLLLALDQAGVLGERPPAGVDERPLLAGYREAAAELRRYLAGEERRSLVAEPAAGRARRAGLARLVPPPLAAPEPARAPVPLARRRRGRAARGAARRALRRRRGVRPPRRGLVDLRLAA